MMSGTQPSSTTLSSVSFQPLKQVRSLEELSPDPLVYKRAAFMKHVRRYDREELRAYYLRQPSDLADIWANYAVNLWEYEHGVEELTSRPWKIAIPMTEVCNAKCTFCSSPLVPEPQALAVHEVQHLADALHYAVQVNLQGLGEPLAHPLFEDVALEIRKHFNPITRLEIITNAWLLSGRRWDLLKSLRIRDIHVSVNAATDATHQIAMGSKPGTFDRVVTNIKNVLSDPDWPRMLKVSMVITRHSLPEVPQFLELFAKLGVQMFQFNGLLPLVTPDWGFGRTPQYLDLWCGHRPDAPVLVEEAAKAIAKYRQMGFGIAATPEQWLDPVDQWRRPRLIQISTGSPEQAPFISLEGKKVGLAPHQVHTHVTRITEGATVFQASPQSCRWAYLFTTPPHRLAPGTYTLQLQTKVQGGELYGGILDVDRDTFIVQKPLGSGTASLEFTLPEERAIEVIIRQGGDDAPAAGVFERGTLQSSSARNVTSISPDVESGTGKTLVSSQQIPLVVAAPAALGVESSPAPVDRGPTGEVAKAGRIYCPMVYTTLSIFHHSLDVSTCCYMETPGGAPPNLRNTALLDAYNNTGFRLVRRTLNSERHIAVCDSCTYGSFRSV